MEEYFEALFEDVAKKKQGGGTICTAGMASVQIHIMSATLK